jgi:hypothetical protein
MHVLKSRAALFGTLDQVAACAARVVLFAAWAMLAAIIALYLLRDYDIKFSLEGGGHA